jgi:hypothetical protein
MRNGRRFRFETYRVFEGRTHARVRTSIAH